MKQVIKSVKKNVRWYMRFLHNKIGFFIVGLVIIYGLSGLLQTYRDTDLLKHDILHEQHLAPNLSESELGSALRLFGFKVAKTEGDILYYKEGTYNNKTGMAKFNQGMVFVARSFYRTAQIIHQKCCVLFHHAFRNCFTFHVCIGLLDV